MSNQANSPHHGDSLIFEIIIVGAGPAGLSAAARARVLGVSYVLLEADPQHRFETIFQYQKGRHITAEPGSLPSRSELKFTACNREELLDNWNLQLTKLDIQINYGKRVNRILRDERTGLFTVHSEDGSEFVGKTVVLGIGLQKNNSKLDIPGDNHPRVQYTLEDPEAFSGEKIVVVGGGDSGIEDALELAKQNTVYLINRDEEFIFCSDANLSLINAAEEDGKIVIFHNANPVNIADRTGDLPIDFVFNGNNNETIIPCHRVIARLGATPPRSLLESFGINFPQLRATSFPVLSESYESNVPNLYIVGALSGYPLIKQALDQGYEVVQAIVGKPVEPADEPLLREKFNSWKPGMAVSNVIDLIRATVPLFIDLSKSTLRELIVNSTLLTPVAGSIIFKKFDYTTTFFSILEGTVDIEIMDADGQLRIITMEKGAYFGEMGLISGRRRTATVRAGPGCVLLGTPRRLMLQLIATEEDVRKQIDLGFIRHALSNYLALPLAPQVVDKIISDGVENRHYNANEILFKEGDAPDGLYLIRRGSVVVSITEEGQERILAYVSAGGYIGEMALLKNEPRSATVTAKMTTEVLVLNGAGVQRQLAMHPSWHEAIAENAFARADSNLLESYDIVIVGSGPAGLSAAARAKVMGVRHVLLEADPSHAADTVFNYQKGKHVMAEPGILPLRSDIGFAPDKREVVLTTWNEGLTNLGVNIEFGKRVNAISRDDRSGLFTVRSEDGSTYVSKAVILAIGMQGNIRKLDIPGANHPLVQYTLADPDAFSGETIIVIGAGDSGIENALGLVNQNTVCLMHRGEEMVLCKEANRTLINAAEKSGKVKIFYSANAVKIEDRVGGGIGESDPPLNFVFNGKDGEAIIPCHRIIARLGATPPRKLMESFGITFPNSSPTSVPVLSETYESNVPNLYVIGSLGGYRLIKQAMNQGYEVVQSIIGKPVTYQAFEVAQTVTGTAVEPVDEPLLREKFKAWKPGVPVSDVIDLLMKIVPLFGGISKLQLRDFMLGSTLLMPPAGSIILKKFDYTNTFFSILNGEVEVEVEGDYGQPKMITLEKGMYFGEMGLISGRRRSATVRAGKSGEPCVVLETPRRSILALMEAVEDVRKQIDAVFIRNAINNFLGPMIPQEAVDALVVDDVEMRRYNANEILFKEGDQADGLYLIRRGSVTVSKVIADDIKRILPHEGKERILAYVPAGHYVGEIALLSDAPRSATVTATVMTEVLVLSAESVKRQLAAFPLWRKSIDEKVFSRIHSNVILERSAGRETDLMRFLLGQGIGEASDVLLIDESLCVQCNNCETACAETHDGTSRLKREIGPSFANVHLPMACRHCETPLCMKDCPPDAISRSEQGEVFISDACIGCGNCERNCPYDVIQMAPQKPPKTGGGLVWTLFGLGAAPGQRQPDYDPDVPQKAVKCDLCKGLESGPACVRACPTGAAIRISPERYFKRSKVR